MNKSLYLYLFPTIFTAANMFCGIYSIILCMKGNFIKSAWMILLGIIFDGLDGMVARARKASSLLGAELDSLADFITFCIAPMILVWQLVMYKYGFAGILVCFIFTFFGGLRLARFNTAVYNSGEYKIGHFIEGLPTPAAAGIIVSIVLLLGISTAEYSLSKRYITFLLTLLPWMLNLLPGLVVMLALLMVTRLRYPKLNYLRLNQKVSFKMFSLILVAVLLIFAYPESSIFIIFSAYILWGVVEYLSRLYRMRKNINTKQL
ncbi:MAG: CDP-diacylglycerol--serine O-phosphatidyltransferase [Endomicrobia bacterium]|nr:CDP-diacylglycerol--serine O-phosphatidyltransferase [Endomicrobiia bacterium]